MQLKGPTNFLFSIFILFMQEYKWLWLLTLSLPDSGMHYYLLKMRKNWLNQKKSFFVDHLGLINHEHAFQKKIKILSLSASWFNMSIFSAMHDCLIFAQFVKESQKKAFYCIFTPPFWMFMQRERVNVYMQI